MKTIPKHVFPDANILLHFPAFDGLDWCQISDADEVVIHITQPVLRELNKIKDAGHTKNVRKRAATVQKRLKQFLREEDTIGNLGKGVSVRLQSRSVRTSDHEGLDPSVADDALIAATLDFRKDNAGADVFLVTDDNGLALMVKAADWKIKVIEPPVQLRLLEVDEEQRERDNLLRKIAKLEESRPSLSLRFVTGGQLLETAPLASDVDSDVASRMAKLKAEHPKLSVPDPPSAEKKPVEVRDVVGGDLDIKELIRRDFGTVQKYNAALDAFFMESERATRKNSVLRCRIIRIELQVDNSGAVPANDVLVNMHFPNGLKPLKRGELRDLFARMPSPPRDPTDFSFLQRGMSSYMPSLSIPLDNPNGPTLSIRETNSYEVRWHAPKLRQGYALDVDPIIVLFDAQPFSFKIEYSIVADNSLDPVNGTLNVIVK